MSTGVECWEQAASESESREFEKLGMTVGSKIFFTSNPNVTRRHQLLITSRLGVAVAVPDVLDVMSTRLPDDSAGMGILWAVMCNRSTGEDD